MKTLKISIIIFTQKVMTYPIVKAFSSFAKIRLHYTIVVKDTHSLLCRKRLKFNHYKSFYKYRH